MIATKPMDLRANLKNYLDNAFNGEPVIVSRKNNRNVVIVSEQDYNDMMKAKRNAEYLAMLAQSEEELKTGKVVVKTMEELEAMENWNHDSNRLVYELSGNQIIVKSCKGHYED